MWKVEFVPLILSETTDIYAIKLNDSVHSEFSDFMSTFKESTDPYLRQDLDRILSSIENISQNGALENFFRIEGHFSDRVCAIPLLVAHRNKRIHGSLRLYCIRVSDSLLLIGGGGVKNSRTYNTDPILSGKVSLLQSIDKRLLKLESEGMDLYNEIMNLTLIIEE